MRKATIALGILLAFIPTFLLSQNLIGKHLSDLKKKYEFIKILSSHKADYIRVVCMEGGYVDLSICVWIDKAGYVKTQLPKGVVWMDYDSYNIDTNYAFSEADYHEGIAPVLQTDNGMYGFVDINGQYVIQPVFNRVGAFSEGLAYYAKFKENCEDSDIGYMDKTGKSIFHLSSKFTRTENCCYLHGSPFRNGVALLFTRENGSDCNSFLQVIIDSKGRVLNYTGHMYDLNGIAVSPLD